MLDIIRFYISIEILEFVPLNGFASAQKKISWSNPWWEVKMKSDSDEKIQEALFKRKNDKRCSKLGIELY